MQDRGVVRLAEKKEKISSQPHPGSGRSKARKGSGFRVQV